MLLLDVGLSIARWAAKKIMEARVGHRKPLAVIEIIHVQPETAIRFQIDEVLINRICINGAAVRREAHEFVLATVYPEAAVVSHGRIKKPEGMGELEMLLYFNLVPTADAPGGGGPLSHAIQGQNRSFFKGAGKEGTRRMAPVMVHEEQGRGRLAGKPAADHAPHHQFLAQPHRHGHEKASNAARRKGQIRLQQALKLQHRLVVKGNEVELLRLDARLFQAILHGMGR